MRIKSELKKPDPSSDNETEEKNICERWESELKRMPSHDGCVYISGSSKDIDKRTATICEWVSEYFKPPFKCTQLLAGGEWKEIVKWNKVIEIINCGLSAHYCYCVTFLCEKNVKCLIVLAIIGSFIHFDELLWYLISYEFIGLTRRIYIFFFSTVHAWWQWNRQEAGTGQFNHADHRRLQRSTAVGGSIVPWSSKRKQSWELCLSSIAP